MKGIRICILLLAAAFSATGAEQEQPGTPALLESFKGKQARVFLQSLENGQLTYQAYKATRNVTVNISKVNKLTFYVTWDPQSMVEMYNAGDFAALISELEPLMEPYAAYMAVENNLREAFVVLMDAYHKAGLHSQVRKMATSLIESGDDALVKKGYISLALVAIEAGELDQAREIMQNNVESEAAKLYMQASIERAEGDPRKAIRTVSTIIIEYSNDLEWLGPSELLCAYLYMDMMEEYPVITTNSPMKTARQVKNIYAGTSEAADARKLWVALGGEALEAAERARLEEMERKEAEKEAKRKADRERMEAERRMGAEDGSADDEAIEADGVPDEEQEADGPSEDETPADTAESMDEAAEEEVPVDEDAEADVTTNLTTTGQES